MNLKSNYISSPALYIASIAVLLTLFFEFWRLILLFAVDELTATVPTSVLLQSFLVGLRFDFSIASYIALPLYVLAIIPFLDIARSRAMRRIHLGLLSLMTAVVFFLHLSDIEFFKFFNSRLNGVALQWTDTPDFMFSMIWESYPVIQYLLMYLIVLAAFLFIAWKLLRITIINSKPSPYWINLVYLPVLVVVFFIGARGRIEEKAPLTWGLAYFSQYDIANQLALNPTFTFLRDAVYDAGSRQETRKLMDRIAFHEAESVVNDLLGCQAADTQLRLQRKIDFNTTNDNPPNVILIIMESFGSTRIGCLDNRFQYELTPYFDSLSEQGILFTNLYSAGSHTYTGIFSTLYGYPTIFGKSIMKQVTGQNRFHGLPSIFRDNGYQTIFFTTHDPHFDNMQGFLMANGFMRMHSLFDYDASEKLSTLGVPDHIMFSKAVQELHKFGDQRFFAAILTATNHGPWFVPDVPLGALPDTAEDHQRLNAFKYSDWALGQLIQEVVKDSSFSNTLIVITADNGMLYKPVIDLDLTQFQIPLLILHTDSLDTTSGRHIDRLGSQVDILPTVMGLVQLDYDDYSFGHNLLDTNQTGVPFAQFSDWYRIGYLENDFYQVNRIDGPSSLYQIDSISRQVDPGRDLTDSLPELEFEMRQKGLAIFQQAYFNMLRPVAW